MAARRTARDGRAGSGRDTGRRRTGTDSDRTAGRRTAGEDREPPASERAGGAPPEDARADDAERGGVEPDDEQAYDDEYDSEGAYDDEQVDNEEAYDEEPEETAYGEEPDDDERAPGERDYGTDDHEDEQDAPEEDMTAATPHGGGTAAGRGRRPASAPGRMSAATAAQAGMRSILELTGKEPEGVTSVAPTDAGWLVAVEIVEDRRVPSSGDILAIYEADLDTDGTLLSYRRTRQYARGRAGGDR